jgi:hypothetical protein
MTMKTESLRLCACGASRDRGVRTAVSQYRKVLARAMADALPSAPPRRSASIADRHLPRTLN